MNIRPAFSSLCAVIAVSSILLHVTPASAQRRVPDRIARQIGNSSTVVIRGNVHPMAIARNDMGHAAASLEMQRMTMVFKSTDQQQSDLAALLEQQQDR